MTGCVASGLRTRTDVTRYRSNGGETTREISKEEDGERLAKIQSKGSGIMRMIAALGHRNRREINDEAGYAHT